MKMRLVHTVNEVREQVKKWRSEGLSIGLVPTMGFLHEGHQSLIAASVKENDRTVVSIFVNPTQFGPNEDFEAYPRDIKKDMALCDETGADLIFNPEPEEMYPDGFCTYTNITGMSDALCGKSRPIHFKGVCTVVSKFFNIVCPDMAYFGEKDAQQLAIIKRMVKDMNIPIEIKGCPIVRESDGLAKSSRNTYLSASEREAALILSKAIFAGRDMVKAGERDAKKVVEAMTEIIKSEPLAAIDYVEMVDVETMQSIDVIEGNILCAIAVKIGKTRLIDNFNDIIHQASP